MHPAYSVIFFTVLSGAGFGFLSLLSVSDIVQRSLHSEFKLLCYGVGFVLATVGLFASMLHLRRPERAWRAFSQWRSSWLSREGVLAVAALAAAFLHAAFALVYGAYPVLTAIPVLLLSLATVYATGMIYAQLKTVARWNSKWTPTCFLGFSIAGGALLYATATSMAPQVQFSAGSPLYAMLALAAAWAAKSIWWKRGDSAKRISSAESATGLGGIGSVRLMESPHSGASYLTREMGYRVARKHARKLRMLAVLAGCAAPIALVFASIFVPGAVFWLSLASLTFFAGSIVERWLFFAESEHAMTAYY